jgi:hypothetical protein
VLGCRYVSNLFEAGKSTAAGSRMEVQFPAHMIWSESPVISWMSHVNVVNSKQRSSGLLDLQEQGL